MREQVTEWIKKQKLFEEGDTVIVGLSGGADSVCLLRLLIELRATLKIELAAVHVEHGIRGEESREDARFVKRLCAEQGIPLQIYEVNVPEYAKKNGIGMEEAARMLRYDCYQKEVQHFRTREGSVKIALAHHADDNAETFLFQMIRGSGIDGLAGMQPKRMLGEEAQIVRPLLAISRKQIEVYLDMLGQDYRTDNTNFDTDYSRNRIRHAVLPELQKINAAAVSHINQSAALLRQMAEYLAREVSIAKERCCVRQKDGILIQEKAFLELPELLQTEIICDVLAEVSGSRKDIGAVHVEQVQKLISCQVGRRICLPYSMHAYREYDGVFLKKEDIANDEKEGTEGYVLKKEERMRLESGETIRLDMQDAQLTFRLLEADGKLHQIHKKKYTKCFNYDMIKGVLRVRRRKAGDYLIVDSAGHKKKLKEYFINEKVPQKERDEVWLLAEDSHIMWVIGGRISACCKIDEHTRKILEVQIVGGKYNENQED